jgi:AcrR family transcriptional regulator
MPRPAAAERSGNARSRKELKKSAATRQRILDAAATIFARNGYGRTLMSDIADEVGIHVTALYYHFDTKDDLAEAVINHVVRQARSAIDERVAALPAETPFPERLRFAIRAQIEHIVARRDYIFAQSKVLYELPEERQENHRALLHGLAVFWRQLLESGRQSGEIRGDFDPGITRMTLFGSMNWVIEWYRPGGRTPAEIADQIAETMLKGFGPPPK